MWPGGFGVVGDGVRGGVFAGRIFYPYPYPF